MWLQVGASAVNAQFLDAGLEEAEAAEAAVRAAADDALDVQMGDVGPIGDAGGVSDVDPAPQPGAGVDAATPEQVALAGAAGGMGATHVWQ